MISDMYNEHSRFNTIEAGRRTGKTLFILDLVQKKALEKIRSNILVVWPNSGLISIYAQGIGQLNRANNFVKYNTGSRVYFRSESDIKYMVGMSFDYIVLDDCHHPETLYRVRPLIADSRGGMLIIGTDVYHNVLAHSSALA